MSDELRRRAVHASGTGLPALYLLDLLSWTQTRWAFVALSLAVSGLETVRLVLGYEWDLFDQLAREYERDNVAGYALFAYSQTAVAWLTLPPVAIPGMLMLAIGDPVSGVLGGTDEPTGKRLGVLAAMFAVCFALAAPFTARIPSASPTLSVVAAAVGALGATLVDGFKPVVAGRVVDDNLSIPPAAATGILLVLSAGGVDVTTLLTV
ncbi:MAG: dolichol kinase [Halolamina sp.]